MGGRGGGVRQGRNRRWMRGTGKRTINVRMDDLTQQCQQRYTREERKGEACIINVQRGERRAGWSANTRCCMPLTNTHLRCTCTRTCLWTGRRIRSNRVDSQARPVSATGSWRCWGTTRPRSRWGGCLQMRYCPKTRGNQSRWGSGSSLHKPRSNSIVQRHGHSDNTVRNSAHGGQTRQVHKVQR